MGRRFAPMGAPLLRRRLRGGALPALALLAAAAGGAPALLGKAGAAFCGGIRPGPRECSVAQRAWRQWENPGPGEGPPGDEIYVETKGVIDVLLIKDHEKLGPAGQVVTVKRGRFRNWLLPRGYAVRRDPELENQYVAKIEENKEIQRQENAKTLDTKKQLEGLGTLTIPKRIKEGTDGEIYGSLTPTNVGELLTQMSGIPVRISSIEVPKIEAIGTYTVTVQLSAQTKALITVDIVPEGDGVGGGE